MATVPAEGNTKQEGSRHNRTARGKENEGKESQKRRSPFRSQSHDSLIRQLGELLSSSPVEFMEFLGGRLMLAFVRCSNSSVHHLSSEGSRGRGRGGKGGREVRKGGKGQIALAG